MDAIEIFEKDNCTIEIYLDDDPMNPREWDNLGTMVCSHPRYNLGDVQIGYKNNEYYYRDAQSFLDWLQVNQKKTVVLPLYLYDHSGITMSTDNSNYPFCDRWDSGQVGYIYITYEKIKEEYGWKIVNEARKQQIKEYLRNEVATYDDYLTGNVYGYNVFCDNCDPDHENSIDSCWGFYGDNWKENGLLDQANTHCDDCHKKTESAYLRSVLALE